MARLRFDDNGYRLQCFAPSENKTNVTTLNVKTEGIIAILLPAQASVQINGAGEITAWPAGVYAMGPNIDTLVFSVASPVVVMK